MEEQALRAPAAVTLQSDVSATVAAGDAPVMVAVNFSAESEEALQWACSYAKSVGAPVEVLHVVHDPAGAPGQYQPNGDDPLEPMTDVAERKLAELLLRFRSAHPDLDGLEGAKAICTRGLPATSILEVARKHRARLLVLGGRDRNGLAEFFLGSTCQQVARHAPMPVTIVRARSSDSSSAA